MTITINDTRNSPKIVLRRELIPGKMYVNEFGKYLIMTDTDSLVDLATGELSSFSDYDVDHRFVPVKGRLEICGDS